MTSQGAPASTTVASINDDGHAGGNIYLGSKTLPVTNGGSFSGIISDCVANGCLAVNMAETLTGGSLVIAGGTLTLSGANSYTGGTTLNAGTLSVGADNNLGAASGGLTFNGGTLQVTGTSYSSTARTIVWGADGGGFDIASSANTFSLSSSQNFTGLGVSPNWASARSICRPTISRAAGLETRR